MFMWIDGQNYAKVAAIALSAFGSNERDTSLTMRYDRADNLRLPLMRVASRRKTSQYSL